MSTVEATRSGVLEFHPKGHGYLRDPSTHYKVGRNDVYVGRTIVDKYQLRPGLHLSGIVDAHPADGPPRLLELTEVQGVAPADFVETAGFDELTAVDPHEPIRLEHGPEPLSTRLMDLLTPIGKGQRGLIVSPPRAGKTVLLRQIADAVVKNHPELHLMVLLVDERPEEVTEMRRGVRGGEVIASSNDHEPEEHIRLAQLAIDRAKRMAESGGQVLVLLDSLTRLARAYNKGSSSGRTMSGGMDIKALDVPKRLFGAARAFDEGGSLTILATCLIETGSRMDELIFQEFKGTGNMELVLDRRLAERRVWPAIDIQQSGTRKEERLLDAETLRRVNLLRRTLADMKSLDGAERLIRELGKSATNADFLDRISGGKGL